MYIIFTTKINMFITPKQLNFGSKLEREEKEEGRDLGLYKRKKFLGSIFSCELLFNNYVMCQY